MEKKKNNRKMNTLYDINKFPAQDGMLIFGISMSKISNAQNAKNCFEHIKHLLTKIIYPRVGLTFLYTDYLYMYSNKPAIELRNKFQSLSNIHKNEFKKILKKYPKLIPNSFSYLTWNQLLLEIKEFNHYFGELKQIYEKDKTFQKYVKEDIKSMKRKFSNNNLLFLLEEILIIYLAAKGKIKFYNGYIQGHEKWILSCYPGKPLKSEIYLFQQNFFKLKNPNNIYENAYYDLEDKKLYEYDYIDLKNLKL